MEPKKLNKENSHRLINTENKLIVATGERGESMGEIGEWG